MKKNTKYEIRNTRYENSLPSAFPLRPSANKKGVAAVMAVFVLILFSLLGLVICPLFSTRGASKVNFLQSQQALQIAEAGRQYAVWYLTTQDNLWTTDWSPEQTLGRGTWRVKVENDTEIIITSKGYVPQETNFRAQRIVKMEGVYTVGEATHPIYDYALYTDSQDIADSPLVFDADDYTLYTTEDNDEAADVHSNETITFLNGSGQVIDGSVYSAQQRDISGWTGTPWRDEDYPDSDEVLPPYMGEETKDYYRRRAQAQGNYDSGDTTLTGDIELTTIGSTDATLIFAESDITIGDVTYRGPKSGSKYLAGSGTIVAGGKITINGYIKPHDNTAVAWNDRCTLALVSFGDTIYQKDEEIIEPPYYEGDRRLNIEDDAGEDTLIFNDENITFSYQRGSNRENYGYLSIANYDQSYSDTDIYIGEPIGGVFSYEFDTSDLPELDDWYYFRMDIYRRTNKRNLQNQIYAYFVEGSPSSPEHSIRCYEDSGFSQETSGFEIGDTVYLEVYADDPDNATITTLDIINYTLTATDCLPVTFDSATANHYRCRFTLPALTTDYWYSLYVTTSEGYYFYKQICIKSSAATDIYSCIYADEKFRVPESSKIKITGNLAARGGMIITPDSPLTELEIEMDAEVFSSEATDPDAIPGAISFTSTWKEVK